MQEEYLKYRKIIVAFLLGKSSSKEEQRLLDWVKADEEHKRFFLREQQIQRNRIVNPDNKQVNLQWKRFLSRINREEKQADTKSGFSFSPVVKVAAAFVAGIIISWMFFSLSNQKRYTAEHQNREIVVPYGAKTNFKLPDGSRIWLNSGSKLSFPLEFKKTRVIQLEGEAYLEVVKNKKPFTVNTTYGRVSVLGTIFNIKAYQDENFQTTLVRGSVLVEHTKSNPVILRPGQQSFVNGQGTLSVKNVNSRLFTSWKEGKLIFQKEPFTYMVQGLERWYNVKIEINSQEMEELRFTGTIEMETLSEVMELICLTMPVGYTYDQNTRTLNIYKKGGIPRK